MRRLAVLGREDEWHVRELLRACECNGIAAECRSFSAIDAICGEPSHYEPFWAATDAMVVRLMPRGSLEQVIFRMDVLGRLEAEGRVVCNPPRSLEVAIDKYLTLTRLEQAGIPVPRTVVVQDAAAGMRAFESLGGDVVVKPLFGSEGRGIIRLTDAELAWRAFKTIERLEGVIYLQQHLRHTGFDVRALVVGDDVFAMKRVNENDFRTNLSRGGRGDRFELPTQWEELARQASRAVGTMVGGVDLLPTEDGQIVVLEVNAVPGWRGIQRVTGVPIAEQIIALVAARLQGR